jgi:predicted ATPase
MRAQRSVEAAAAECFHRTIQAARQQGARLLELRATTSLARLLQKQGKPDEARAMPADIYGWFTEGFDTADLRDAKTLLEELRAFGASGSGRRTAWIWDSTAKSRW